MYSIFNQLESSVKESILRQNYSSALDAVKDFIVSINDGQASPVELCGSRKIDELCEIIGDDYFRRFFSSKLPDHNYIAVEKRIIIVCSGLYKQGSTSPVINDLVKAHPGYGCTVIATNYLNDISPEDIGLSRIDGTEAVVSICPPGKADEKLHWLIRRFLDISASRIFLLNHHQDSVLIAAARPFVRKAKVIFYHHADRDICLGVHMDGAIHVDTHDIDFYNCRHKEGLLDNVYVPLTVDDGVVHRAGSVFMRTAELTSCSSGPYHRFRNFYLYPYSDLLVDRLKVRSGRHIHIGGISSPELTAIRHKLTSEGIDADRFVHVPYTESLWRTLVDHEIDLFIASFPIGDARTTIEVMSAGIPILMPENYLSRSFSSRDIAYPDAFLWKYPADFANVLHTVTPKALSMHAARSRAHYSLQYSSDCVDVEGKIDAICAGLPTPAPYGLYPYQPDHLDKALHFSHIAHLAATDAAQQAIASIANDEMPSGRGFAHAFASLRDKVIGEKAVWPFKTRKSDRLRRELLEAVNRLSPDDRDLYHVISQRPASIGFDPEAYLERNPDVARAGTDPLFHFVEYGQYEGREPTFFTGVQMTPP